jgi:Dyp-type peroxidase family
MAPERDEVQGNVLYAYGTAYRHAAHDLVRVREGRLAAARAAVAAWSEAVTFGRSDRTTRKPHVNLAFTYSGLEALGVEPEVLAHFPVDFRAGAVARSRDLERGVNAAEMWEPGFGESHVLLSVHSTDGAAADGRLEELHELAGDAFERCGARQRTGLLERTPPPGADDRASCGVTFDREHFGFADGCSQPAIEGVDDDPVGDGTYARVLPKPGLQALVEDLVPGRVVRRWRTIRLGEFVLGYENEDVREPEGPPAPLGPNGTFMVFRKLRQHVDRWNAFIQREAARLELGEDELKARIIGRWPSGAPLLGAEEPPLAVATDRRLSNEFTFAEDPSGLRCPLGSHVRRTNPRDGLPGGNEVTMRHRIIRRGMPYGEVGEEDCGLLFICFSAGIARGFETIQAKWCNDGEVFGLGDEPDFLLQQGDRPARMLVGVRDDRLLRLESVEPFVTVRGCEYLFVPSRRACAWLGAPLSTS